MAPLLAVEFYNQLMVELIGAFGLALVVANVFALFRRRPADPLEGEPGRPGGDDEPGTTLTRAPIARTVLFAAIGAVMFVWALATYLRF